MALNPQQLELALAKQPAPVNNKRADYAASSPAYGLASQFRRPESKTARERLARAFVGLIIFG
jgi:hypothetical protein